MGASIRPESPGERIKRNIAAMKAQGASEADIEAYLVQREGLKPETGPSFDNALTQTRPAAKSESLKDAVTGFAQGAGFNFGDEVAAGSVALLNKLFHPTQPSHYDELKKEASDYVKAGAERSPFLTTAGNLGGALTAGVGAGAAAKAVLGGAPEVVTAASTSPVRDFLMRRGKSIAAGAGAGALAGLGAGDEGHRLETAGEGALFGGGATAVFHGLGDAARLSGVPALVRNLMPRPELSESRAGRIASKVGIASHEQKAFEDVLADIRRSGLSIDEYLSRSSANPNAALYDLGPSMNTTLGAARAKVDPSGDPLVRRARGAQSVPSRGSSQLSDFVNSRAEQRPGQVKDALEKGIDAKRENVVDLRNAKVEARGDAADPAYAKAFEHGTLTKEGRAEFQKLLATKEFRSAWNEARALAKDEGHKLPKIQKVKITGNLAGEEGPTKFEYQFVEAPDYKTVDYVKRVVDEVIEAKMRSGPGAGGISRARGVMLLKKKNAFLDAIDKDNPDYAAARSGFAGASKEIRGGDLGEKFWATRGDDLESQWRLMTDDAKQQYRKTALASIEDRLGSGMNPAQLLNEVNARKLRIIAGSPEAYRDFEKSLRMAIQGASNDAMITGGSPTARILAEQADGGEASRTTGAMMNAATGNFKGLFDKVVQNSAARRMRGLNEARVDALAPILTSSGEGAGKNLLLMKELQKALDEALASRGLRTGRAIGAVAGSSAGKR